MITKNSLNSKNQSATPFRDGFIVGLGAMIILFIIVAIAIIKTTHVNGYKDNSTTLNHALAGIEFDQISKGKACSIADGCNLDVAIFLGEITPNSAILFTEFLDANKGLKTVCLGSTGGEIQAATKISSYIVKHNLTTCIADYYELSNYDSELVTGRTCGSACNQIFLSAKTRIQIGSLALFKGHGTASGATWKGNIFGTDWKLNTASLIGSDSFTNAIKNAGTKDKAHHLAYNDLVSGVERFKPMRTLTRGELMKYRIFTHTYKKVDGVFKYLKHEF